MREPGNDKSEHPAAPAGEVVDFDLLPDLLGYQLKRGQLLIFNSFADHLRGLGLTSGQFGLLVLIGANPGLTQSALAGAVGSNRSLMVRTIDRLEDNGLVTRRQAENDRRSHSIVITRKGAALVERLKRDVRAHEDRKSGTLSGDEARTLLELLVKLNRD